MTSRVHIISNALTDWYHQVEVQDVDSYTGEVVCTTEVGRLYQGQHLELTLWDTRKVVITEKRRSNT